MNHSPRTDADPALAPRRSIFAPVAWAALLALAAVAFLAGPARAQNDTQNDAQNDAQNGDARAEASVPDEETLERRVITIDGSGGTQSGNLRYGPLLYRHPEPLGIVATVSTLTIRSAEAELSGPEDTLLTQARGERTARFVGETETEVEVTRGRLAAHGPALVYREATGLGLLNGGVRVHVAPPDEDGDETDIRAASAEFDVDRDRSVTRGEVVLLSGTQRGEADEMTFAEARDLGVLTCEALCTVVREDPETGTLRITAREIRVLTQDERLWARGDVTVVNGDIVTEGDEAVYDDHDQVAEVTGTPAVSVDEAAGLTLESDRIRHDVRFDFVEAIDASQASDVTLDDFLLEEERGDGAGPDASGGATEGSVTEAPAPEGAATGS